MSRLIGWKMTWKCLRLRDKSRSRTRTMNSPSRIATMIHTDRNLVSETSISMSSIKPPTRFTRRLRSIVLPNIQSSSFSKLFKAHTRQPLVNSLGLVHRAADPRTTYTVIAGCVRFKNKVVGGVYMVWFMIWLEIVWLTLWLGRIIAKCIPWPMGLVSGLFTNNGKKWRDMGKQLELPASLFSGGLQ